MVFCRSARKNTVCRGFGPFLFRRKSASFNIKFEQQYLVYHSRHYSNNIGFNGYLCLLRTYYDYFPKPPFSQIQSNYHKLLITIEHFWFGDNVIFMLVLNDTPLYLLFVPYQLECAHFSWFSGYINYVILKTYGYIVYQLICNT